MSASEPAGYGVLEGRIGYTFRDRTLCESALTHKSWLNERHGSTRTDNERLEFLGDAVLGLVVTDHLFRTYPDMPEGEPALGREGRDRSIGFREGQTFRRLASHARFIERIDERQRVRFAGQYPSKQYVEGRRYAGVDHGVTSVVAPAWPTRSPGDTPSTQ